MDAKIDSINKLTDSEMALFGIETPEQAEQWRKELDERNDAGETKIEMDIENDTEED